MLTRLVVLNIRMALPASLAWLAIATAGFQTMPATAGPTEGDTWQVVGRMGIAQFVIVPAAKAADAAAYLRQIDKLCARDETCFVNFYTNSTGVTAELPLPDAIAAEATARFRRSMKSGMEMFEWSCRIANNKRDCF